MFSDIEIAQQASSDRSRRSQIKAGIPEEYVIPYGRDKAKISLDFAKTLEGRPGGKLILVTATTPHRSRRGMIR